MTAGSSPAVQAGEAACRFLSDRRHALDGALFAQCREWSKIARATRALPENKERANRMERILREVRDELERTLRLIDGAARNEKRRA